MIETKPKTPRRKFRFKTREGAEDACKAAEDKAWRHHLAIVDLIAGKVQWIEDTVEEDGEQHKIRLGLVRLAGADGGLVIVENQTLTDKCSPNTDVWRLDDYRDATNLDGRYLSTTSLRYATALLVEKALRMRSAALDEKRQR